MVLKLLIGQTSDPSTQNCFIRFSSGAATTGRTDGDQCGQDSEVPERLRLLLMLRGLQIMENGLRWGIHRSGSAPKSLKEKRKANNFYFGIEEGTIVYIRARKLYKSSPGIPMAVTHRACVVGNEREEDENNENWFGQILSFVGQLSG